MAKIAESVVEEAALDWFQDLGWIVEHGPDIAPGEPAAERESYSDVILHDRLESAIDSLNPDLPGEAKEEALRKVLHLDSPSLVLNNRVFHRMLTNGVEVEIAEDGRVRGEQVQLVDFENPVANDWLVVNQFTVIDLPARGAQAGGQHNRRPDIVIFLNGIPLAVIELKNPTDENATIESARKQLDTYKREIPSLFNYNELLVISDGMEARMGSLTASREWFLPWHTIDGDGLAPPTMLPLDVLIKGVFEKDRFLDYIRHFIVFEEDGNTVAKKIAGYHQFHATRKAVDSTLHASAPSGDHRGGVVWHTQGAGKSLTMVFFAGKLILHPAMRNPTIVVITDRNDLDDQLFGTFSRCHEILRQKPVQAKDRADLRKKLAVASGGVVFSTIQKFFPEEKGDTYPLLSDRNNIVVIADEAHRSQYDFIDGFARHIRDALPNATFVGFTGTPIEFEDRNTRHVFGDYISIYDIEQAVADGATVPIYYESRIAKLDLSEEEKPRIDPEFEEVTEGEEIERKERLKTKWAQLEAIVGTDKRLSMVARDLLEHFDVRLSTLEGKAMVVGMSRRICVAMYNQITALRPQWGSDDDEKGVVKVVMSGSASDPADWQPHIRNKARRERLAQRFKDPNDSLKLVIVRDMWLTGFDVPCLHTMYIDKPMKGHTLMQAIARVNRVFRDKPGGLIVDYLGLADSLRRALATYTQGGGRGKPMIDQREAVAVMLEKLEICRDYFHGFDYSPYLAGSPSERLAFLPFALQHLLSQDEPTDKFIVAVVELSKAFALSVPQPEVLAARDEVAFFQAVKATLVKHTVTRQRPADEIEPAIRQIVSAAIVPDRVIDILEAAGIKKPDISILSDEFLAEVRGLPQKNLAVELLRKLLNDEIKTRQRKNLIQSRSFAEMLERTIHRYKNRAIETVQVIEELIELAKEMREAAGRGEKLGLTEEELAFYDALETNDSAVKVMGDEILSQLARELAETVRNNATIDWTLRESARARLRVMVKRALRQYGYPPDKQAKATQTVVQQAELLGEGMGEMRK